MALCRITHTFMDASGNPVPGVVVRFTPLPVQDVGLVAREVTVMSSNAEGTLGEIDFSLIQGLRGTLSMTHVPLVREVTIPFTDAAGLLDLVANTPDPLEPIDREFIDLPEELLMVAVTLRTVEGAGPQVAVAEVRVRVYSEDGLTFITEGDSDADGQVVLLLDDLTTYWVRFFKSGWRFPTKARIFVDEAQGWVSFDAIGTDLIATPTSTDPTVCRASGQAVSASGVPSSGVVFHFLLTEQPTVSDGRIVLQEAVTSKSGPFGKVEVDLLRGAIYEVTMSGRGGAGLDGFSSEVLVPDSEAVRLSDLLWPYVADVEVDDAPVSLAVGASVELGVAARLSSGIVTPYDFGDEVRTLGRYVRVIVDDPAVIKHELAVEDGVESLTLTARAAGTATVTFEVLEGAEASRLPAVVRTFPEISVTVT